MRPLVLFPDVEAFYVGYLAAALTARDEPYTDDVYVSNTVPESRAARMVIVRRDGGPRLDVVREAARLGIRVWAETDEDAADLANMTRALVVASAGEGPVRRASELAGPVTIPDESEQPLRYFTAEVVVVGLPA